MAVTKTKATAASKNGAKTATVRTIVIPDVQRAEQTVYIIGLTDVIMHRYDDKTRARVKDKAAGNAVQPEKILPEDQFERSKYQDEKGYYFPSSWFKGALVWSGSSLKGVIDKTVIRQAVHVTEDRIRFVGKVYHREDIVRVGRSGVVRHRAAFEKGWRAAIPCLFNEGILSLAQIFNLWSVAGFGVGVGELRPQKSDSGSCGLFRLATEKEIKTLKWA